MAAIAPPPLAMFPPQGLPQPGGSGQVGGGGGALPAAVALVSKGAFTLPEINLRERFFYRHTKFFV